MTVKSDQEFLQRRSELINSAHQIFDKMKKIAEEEGKKGQVLSVRDVAHRAGLEITEKDFSELGIPAVAQPLTFLSWDSWFPFRALWAHYWRVHLPSSPAARSFGARAGTADLQQFIGSMDMP
jgi:hypothetical protein